MELISTLSVLYYFWYEMKAKLISKRYKKINMPIQDQGVPCRSNIPALLCEMLCHAPLLQYMYTPAQNNMLVSSAMAVLTCILFLKEKTLYHCRCCPQGACILSLLMPT
jgi:hypothetical protein